MKRERKKYHAYLCFELVVVAEQPEDSLLEGLKKTEKGLEASVKPVMLPEDNPLSAIRGAGNAIQYRTDLLGEITLIGPGAGRKETAAALIEDLLHIVL